MYIVMHSLLFKIIKFTYYSFIILLLKCSLLAAENNVLIYAAASTNDIFKEIQKNIEKDQNIKISISTSSSSTLAKQITAGAPANIYISASAAWIKELDKNNLLSKDHIKPIFKNRLVLISSKNSEIKNLKHINEDNLSSLFKNYLKNSRISIADPNHVPAGIYTKEALEELNVWTMLDRENMAWGGDVRRTLKFVSLGNCPLGIVYYTDAIADPNVKIIGFFDETLHSPINYWAAIIKKNTNNSTIKLYNYLLSNLATNIYIKYGFEAFEREE